MKHIIWLLSLAVGASLLHLQSGLSAQEDASAARWLWTTAAAPGDSTLCFRREFSLEEPARTARLFALLDHCRGTVFLNGQRLQDVGHFAPLQQSDITELLRKGKNTLLVGCRAGDGPAALALRVEWVTANQPRHSVVSDLRWEVAVAPTVSSAISDPSALAWKPVESRGPVASGLLGDIPRGIEIDHLDDYTQWKDALNTTTGTNPASFDVPPGFEVRLLRSAEQDEDSWVCLTQDPQGRWIIAREKRGLLRLTPAAEADQAPTVEVINEELAECRGLLFVQGDLFAMANNDKALYRLRDTTGDDQFDDVQRLKTFDGDVGHGRNQLTLGPDGKIYAIFGDAVFAPAEAQSAVPAIKDPIPAERARSGFVARTDTDGQNWEVLVRGLRNPFGIDFNSNGDMFTYDADAEYDMGSPWYRPTRVNHLLIGGDYGWRRVTGQWPPYFPDRPDTPQPTLDIGKGSPTAVEFGQGDRFPEPYRDALFVLDWAYGRILAVHWEPRGASYLGTPENFLRGRPLNVTDLEFGQDGAMYFVTGGRGTQSALYRVDYVGPARPPAALTPQQQRRRQTAAEHRAVLARLQAAARLQADTSATPVASELPYAWQQLQSDDPWIRHAARTAVETRPLEQWRDEALTAEQLDLALASLTALLRIGSTTERNAVAERLLQLDWHHATPQQEVEFAFLARRCLELSIETDSTWRAELLAKLAARYPAANPEVNRWLSRVLSEFGPDDSFVAKTLPLLRQARTQGEQLHYLFVLRDVTNGWSDEDRDTYFNRLAAAKTFVTGEGMPTFLRLISQEAIESLPPAERDSFEQRLASADQQGLPPVLEPVNRPFVREWKVSDFSEPLDLAFEQRDLERGARLFRETSCFACHRFGPRGGVLGPDLTAVGNRFAPYDLLVSMLEPSRVIAEKYQSETFELQDGQTITGRVVAGDYRSEKLEVMPDLMTPEKRVEFLKAEVLHREGSPLSPMPTGLLDTLDRDELLDLVAYLTSGYRPGED